MVDGLCRRYSCLPSELLREDVGILRMVALVNLGKEDDGERS